MKNQKKEPLLIKDLGMMSPKKTSNYKAHYGIYKCPYCGKDFKAQMQHIKNRHTKSCGCIRNNHNMTGHKLSPTWYGMMERCYNNKNKSYIWYGAKGVTVCDRWKDIRNFVEDMYPSYHDGLTLDRIDPYGNYELSNCRWVDQTTQNRNTRLLQKNNTSGFRGVSRFRNKYRACIAINYKQIHLGYFKTAEEAAQAYDSYVLEYNLEHTRNLVLDV